MAEASTKVAPAGWSKAEGEVFRWYPLMKEKKEERKVAPAGFAGQKESGKVAPTGLVLGECPRRTSPLSQFCFKISK